MSGPILAIETSCDDSCAAVLAGDGSILSNVISSQSIHDRYGGVVPEIAARHHLELLTPAIDSALAQADLTLGQIDRVAVTQGPGLIGALLVGVGQAKAIAAARSLPLVAVDHLQGHIAANFISPQPFEPPFICLIASGGHTLLARVEDHSSFVTLGETLDDAAGEAFDKGARMLDLPFPGGPALEALAATGDAEAFDFPTARNVKGCDFSFAGVKTALLYAIRDLGEKEVELRRADLAASYQQAIVEALTDRLSRALEADGGDRVAIGGGVAANGPLREQVEALGVNSHIPARDLCTDNAAMIASAARFLPDCSHQAALALDAYPSGAKR
ncbi:MAG: tRNA (adenosine(37)-N6)-threonylcarbamoyltransferase complex transferase subunit TsaD [Solirubrobacteraceae bacterium]|jgi:N6-L-threonylcarbamoyladenine synthase|nr:tRNA (adenosine(37)-N6)-threonylcarbamoyltransferase complex transferase subunit TsaD [Solirubrobacteraceae bacterium]MDP4921283.1 tRNA (adenosine(37)-N6)-threonylcarbamoyltransferase complex transferase subunit TsaD [Solirubrobacteraceae bacterium]